MADAEVRQRKPKAAEVPEEKEASTPEPDQSAVDVEEEEDRYSPWVDILRVITFLALASWVLSYLFSGGESGFWGMTHKPKMLKVDWWKAQLQGPIYLTPEELANYDGTDETKPVYLAINGTIYDVSNGRHIYGPGGSYRFFAGCDAARAYVTGCFAEDRTPDMRGVEEMFLPLDDPATDAHWTPEQLDKLRADELAAAKKKVNDGLRHWVEFFANSKKYNKVGYVKLDADWLEKQPRRALCESARKGRGKRKIPKA
jgi:predicted heme/steroid binding protein